MPKVKELKVILSTYLYITKQPRNTKNTDINLSKLYKLVTTVVVCGIQNNCLVNNTWTQYIYFLGLRMLLSWQSLCLPSMKLSVSS